jgi:hypothetical protein
MLRYPHTELHPPAAARKKIGPGKNGRDGTAGTERNHQRPGEVQVHRSSLNADTAKSSFCHTDTQKFGIL